MKIKDWLIVIKCDEEMKKPLMLKKALQDINEELAEELIKAVDETDTPQIEKLLYCREVVKIIKTICEKRNKF